MSGDEISPLAQQLMDRLAELGIRKDIPQEVGFRISKGLGEGKVLVVVTKDKRSALNIFPLEAPFQGTLESLYKSI
jgi:hypothetical protein